MFNFISNQRYTNLNNNEVYVTLIILVKFKVIIPRFGKDVINYTL